MTVSRAVKNGRPSNVWVVVAKNFLTETGYRYGSYSRSVSSQGEAVAMAENLLQTAQAVLISQGISPARASSFFVLSKNGTWKEVTRTKRK